MNREKNYLQNITPAGGRKLRIAFLHPELGIGGSERLVVDAAIELRKRGHEVTIFTSRHATDYSFEETLNGTIDIRIRGRFIPSHLLNRFRAPCSIARMTYAALAMARSECSYDIVFCDLIPHVIPLIRFLTASRIVFYCHYPDMLLAPERSCLYSLYRFPIDRLEETGLRMADRILVNSLFTAGVLREAFPRLAGKRVDVLYPGIDLAGKCNDMKRPASLPETDDTGSGIILSLNRYFPGKNLGMAIDSFGFLKGLLPEETFRQLRLVFAGACDDRLPESRITLRQLQGHVAQLNLQGQVTFLQSVTDAEAKWLLTHCICLVYTSLKEHFGIGIVEAMAAGRPVLAVNQGGPLETVVNGTTGFLCDPAPEAFAKAIARIVSEPAIAELMGHQGKQRAAEKFSLSAFGERLENIMRDLSDERNKRYHKSRI